MLPRPQEWNDKFKTPRAYLVDRALEALLALGQRVLQARIAQLTAYIFVFLGWERKSEGFLGRHACG